MVDAWRMGFIRSLTHGKEYGATLSEIPEDESAPLDNEEDKVLYTPKVFGSPSMFNA